jgi:hypothetical protein
MKLLPIICLALHLCAARVAYAQAIGAEAEILFREGKALLAKGEVAKACAAFDASQNLDPGVSTQLNQANCREKNQQLATAWGLFLKVQQQLRNATDETSRQLRAVAADRAGKLEPRLSTLTITVPAANQVAGLEIKRDDAAIEVGAWERPLPVDGGTYRLSARAPGHQPWTTTVTVANEGDRKTVDVPALKKVVVAANNAVAAPRVADSAPATRPAHSRTAPLVLVGSSVVLASAAVGFALWGDSLYRQAKTEPNDAEQRSLWKSANNRRYIAEGMAVASAACAGVSLWLYWRRGRSEPRGAATSSLDVAPAWSHELVGLSMAGRF